LVKISIVIPVYNTEKYVAECIESCLNQTYKDYEIIIIDDGSTDKSVDIISEYHKNNKNKITLIHKENGGTASALNTGFERMKGEWFKWVSADDVLYPTALETMMDLIEKIPDNTQYIYYTDFVEIDQNSKVIKIRREPDRTIHTSDENSVELMYHSYGNGSTSMIHRSLFHTVGKFREGLRQAEDLEFWMRACIKFKYQMYHLNLITLSYRRHSESLTSATIIPEYLELVESFRSEYKQYLTKEQIKYLNKLNASTRFRGKIVARLPAPIREKIVKIYRSIK